MLPVTNEDFGPGPAIARLEALLAAPPLTLSVEGGGLPDRHAISPEGAVLIERREVEFLVWLLRRLTPSDTPHLVTPPPGPAPAG